ncbi:hypothetical protein [Haloglomus halophilum]|uniref:hypothetical protein n=1 Tax=Haloglomus halophilum TaxID=2962672 RepID=UPI0020C95284|nr:hypothetical protein [Haloglomus halophilum]
MIQQRTAVVLAAVAVIGAVAVLSGAVGAAPSGETVDTDHGVENGNYTVDLPFATDHYPRDENPGGPYNASINHLSASTPEQLEAAGGKKGIEQAEFIIVSNQDTDFSQCETSNTGAFGIDRDNDDGGTVTDVGLLQYRENSRFKKHSIVVNLYEGDELASPSPSDKGGPGENPGEKGQGREDGDGNAEVYPDDEIVSHQGYKAGGGPCYGMPTEPGWYQMTGFLNGTAFNGNYVELTLPSHYFYICECQSEKEAYDQLGAPPGQENPYADGSGSSDGPSPEATATATATPESSGGVSESSDATATATATAPPTATATATPTPEPADGDGGSTATAESSGGAASTVTATNTAAGGGGGGAGGAGGQSGGQQAQQAGGAGGQSSGGQARQQQAAGVTTPTAGSGPGFGLVAALGGVLAAALLAFRRD